MPRPKSLIDFKELISAVPGEGLEELTRQLGRRKGLSPTWAGRGADGGRDLYFTEILAGPLIKTKITWLVSCKDKALSEDSVSERDLPPAGITDKLKQHHADGFLLVTTTTVSTGAKQLLDSLDESNGGNIHTLVWDASELISMLLEPSNHDIVKQFFPQSYQRVKGLTSLEGAIQAFRDQIPEEILEEIITLALPYANPNSTLKGSTVWPFDVKAANQIDQITKQLLIVRDVATAVSYTEGLDLDALLAFAERVVFSYRQECFDYLYLLIRTSENSDVVYNAYQFLSDNFQLTRHDILVLGPLLGDESSLITCAEVLDFVKGYIQTNEAKVRSGEALTQRGFEPLTIEISVKETIFEIREQDKIHFFGFLDFTGKTRIEPNTIVGYHIQGDFDGYFTENEIVIEDISVRDNSEMHIEMRPRAN